MGSFQRLLGNTTTLLVLLVWLFVFAVLYSYTIPPSWKLYLKRGEEVPETSDSPPNVVRSSSEKLQTPASVVNISSQQNSSSRHDRSVDSWCSQEKRVRVLEEGCRRLNRSFGNYQQDKSILVDDKHKLIFCMAAKGGSTAWLHLLIRASGKLERGRRVIVHSRVVQKRFGIVPLGSYSKEEAKKRLENYFKFIVVRHPIERVVSAWYDKIIMPDGPYKKLGRKAAEKYKSDRTERQNNTDPAYWKNQAFFVEFARHLAETRHRDPHWESFDRSCNPCTVKWDAIIKLESTSHDSELVLSRLRDNINDTNLPINHSHQKKDGINHFSKKLEDMRDIRPEVLRYLHQQYDNDLNLFGYHWDQENLMATCGLPQSKDACC